MSAAKRQARFERFASHFLRPLLEGGEVEVARPLPPTDLDHFALAASSDLDVDQAIYGALHRTASEIAPIRRLPFPERGTLALAMAAHNLLFITDPHLDRAFSRGARPEVLGWVDTLIEAVGIPRTRAEVLSRHALVDRLVLLAREDVIVKNWASTYRFHGRSVPGNVVALPRLRRVRRETSLRDLSALLVEFDASTNLDAAQRMRAIIKRAAITEFLHLREESELAFGAVNLAALADSSLAAGVARQLVARGLEHAVVPLGRACILLREADTPPAWLATAIGFIVRTFLIDAAAKGGPTNLDALLSRHAAARLCVALCALSLEDERLLPWLVPLGEGAFGIDEGPHDDASMRLARAMIDAARPSLTHSPSPTLEEAVA